MTEIQSIIFLSILALAVILFAIYHEYKYGSSVESDDSSKIKFKKSVNSINDLNSIENPVHGDMVYVISEKSIYIYDNTWTLVSTYYEEDF